MRKARPEDKKLVKQILSKSFIENRSINYVVKQDVRRLKRINHLMEYSFDVCSDFGEVFISEDGNGCVLVLFPHLKRTTFRGIKLDILLAIKAIGLLRIFTVLGREAKIKKYHSKSPFAYLWFIGVDTEFQKKGIGSELMNTILNRYEKAGLPVYLETSTLSNLPWYKRHGFHVYREIDFTYKLFLLKRELKSEIIFK